MASPFSLFRKNQKILMAVFGIMAMIAFVFMDAIDMTGGRGDGDPDPVVVESKFFDLRRSQIEHAKANRIYAQQFLRNCFYQVELRDQAQFASQFGQQGPQLVAAFARQAADQRVGAVTGPVDDESIVESLLFAEYAKQLGIVVSDHQLVQYVLAACRDGNGNTVVTSDGLTEILGSIGPEGKGISQERFDEALRTELLAAEARRILIEEPTQSSTPLDRWDYFQRKQLSAKVEVVPVRAADIVDDGKVREPSGGEVAALYDEFKFDLPSPGSPDPGFKRPQRGAFQYFAAEEGKFYDKAKFTPEEVQKYYDDNKSRRIGKDGNELYKYEAEDYAATAAAATAPASPNASTPVDPRLSGSTPATATPSATVPPPAATPSSTIPATGTAASVPSAASPAPPTATPSATPAAKPADGSCDAAEGDTEGSADDCQVATGTAPQPTATPAAAPAATTRAAPAPNPSPTAPNPTASNPSPTAPSPTAPIPTAPNPTAPNPTAPNPTAPAPAPQSIDTGTDPVSRFWPRIDPAKLVEPPKPDIEIASSTDLFAEPDDVLPPDDVRTGKNPLYTPLWRVEDDVRLRLARNEARETITKIFADLRKELDQNALTLISDPNRDLYTPEQWQAIVAERYPRLEAATTGMISQVEAFQLADGMMIDPQSELAQHVGLFQAEVDTQSGASPFGFQAFAQPVKYSLTETRAVNTDERGRESDDSEKFKRYLVWMTKHEDDRVPELDEVRNEVVRAWKMREARAETRKQAEDLAARARQGGRSLLEMEPSKARETKDFTWYQVDTSGNLVMKHRQSARISSVEGVEDAGQEFMQTVFSLDPGEVAVAMNEPQTVCYVIRMVDLKTLRPPAPAKSQPRSALFNDFAAAPDSDFTSTPGGMFGGRQPGRYLGFAMPSIGRAQRDAYEKLLADAKVRWIRDPAENRRGG